MTTSICFANQKGGVGKTTLSLQLVYELQSRGKRVLAIDFDSQGNFSSRIAFDVPEEQFVGTRTLDLYSSEDFEVKPVKCSELLDLIYAKTNDAELGEIEAASLDIIYNVKKHLDKIKHNYDFIIIDSPPSLGRNLIAALSIATHVVTVIKVSGFGVDGAEGLMTSINAVKQDINPGLINAGLLINMFDNSPTHNKTLKVLQDAVGNGLFKNVIRYRTPIDTATSEGLPIKQLTYAHVAAAEIHKAIDEIFERVK